MLPPGPGLKPLSTAPSTSNRARLVRAWPPSFVKLPQTRILPSVWTASADTELALSGKPPVPPTSPGVKLPSKLPSGLSLARLVHDCPPSLVKLPPARIFPSGCTARDCTSDDFSNGKLPPPRGPGLKLSSTVPFALRRAKLVRTRPPRIGKSPPTRIPQ